MKQKLFVFLTVLFAALQAASCVPNQQRKEKNMETKKTLVAFFFTGRRELCRRKH